MDKELKTIYAGKETIIKIPEANIMNVVSTHTAPILHNPEEKLKKLLENPIGGKKLVDIVKPGDKVALVSSEYTRMPFTWILAPVVVDLLKKEGVKEKNITLINAPGTHQTEEQQAENPLVKKLYGPLYGKYKMVLHDCDKRDTHTFVGYTSQGTPVWVNKAVAEADVTIGFGELAIHHAAGHCGGGKIILPGVSARATIGSMHRRVMTQKSKYHEEWQQGAWGNDEKNEVRRDIEDAAELAGLSFKIDTVTGRPGELLYDIFAGDFRKEFREGVKTQDKIHGTKIREKTDICIYLSGQRGTTVSGSFLYAPFMADQATKDDGIVIQVVSAENGWAGPGGGWFPPSRMVQSSEEMAWRLTGDIDMCSDLRNIALAWQVKRALELKTTYMVTEYQNKELLQALGMKYITNSFDEALAKALKEKGKDATITVLDQGGYILPPN